MMFYAEILRGVGARDNNFKPSLSNDPSTATSGWIAFGGAPATRSTDGDILTFSGTSPSKGVYNGATAPNFGVSTTTYPYLVVRLKAVNPGTIDILVNYVDLSQQTFTLTLTTAYTTFSNTMNSGKTINNINFQNQSVAGNILCDFVYVCSNTPLQLSQKDLVSGTSARLSKDCSHAELRLNNSRGKFVSGTNSVGFGDHLHIYLGQANTLYHRYGGYVEYLEPIQPNDELILNSRGWELGLMETIAQKVYTSSTPQTIFNDFIDNFVNASNKDGTGIASNYQITRSYVQPLGSSIPLYITSFKSVWDAMKEISDLTVAQGTPSVFFVDPAENLHFVPLGTQGAANWTTDPIPANYGTGLTVGKNVVTYNYRKDVSSLRNRVHYFGVTQAPGNYDAWTEGNASSWGSERLTGNGISAAFSDDTTILATGAKSVKCGLTITTGTAYGGAMFYPSTKDLHLNLAKLGSTYSPLLFDSYFRVQQGGAPKVTVLGGAPTIFFAKDATHRAEFNYVSDGNTAPLQSILGVQGINNVTDNYWYHTLISIGPNGGSLFNSTPVANTVAPAIYTGSSQYFLQNVGGAFDWTDVNYIGYYWQDGGGVGGPGTVPFWFDGFRILGGNYTLAYDNRSVANGRYPDMREIYFYDPVSKDAGAIKNYATAELKRLRDPIVRASFTTTLLADANPEQQVQVTSTSANLSNTYLRITGVIHRFSPQGFLSEFQLSNDFTNSQPLDLWKLTNALLQMGENAIISREVYDLKSALLDPSFTPTLVAVT